MAPNRSSVASVLRSLSSNDLAGFVTESKYAPLTFGAIEAPTAPAAPSKVVVEQQQQVEEQQQVEVEESKPAAAASYWDETEVEEEEPQSESYWGWPSLTERADSVLDAAEAEDAAQEDAAKWDEEVARREAVVAQILADEAARAVVCTANIEANLIKDAAKAKEAAPVEMVRSTEPVQEASYWDWDAETDSQEAAASTFAAAHIEENLKKEAIRIRVHQYSPQEKGAPKPSYWDWETLSPDQDKARLIASILEDERARQLLTSSHLEANLKNASSSTAEVVHSEAKSSENYWDWDGEETKEEEVHAPHTQDSTHPANSYWDWTPATTPEESKTAIIQRILADEAARQTLTAQHIQDNLKSAPGPNKSEVVRNIGKSDSYWEWEGQEEAIQAPHTHDATHPNNKYWDWKPTLSADESKAALIHNILADEAARQALTVTHTEKTIKKAAWTESKGEVDRWYNHTEKETVHGEEKEEGGYWDM